MSRGEFQLRMGLTQNADELAELSRAEAVLREDRFLDEESTVS